jgi:uncharacterized short protein YbdD (DUF466 family)
MTHTISKATRILIEISNYYNYVTNVNHKITEYGTKDTENISLQS